MTLKEMKGANMENKEILKELKKKLDYQRARYEAEKNREVRNHLFGKFTGYEQALIDLNHIINDKERG